MRPFRLNPPTPPEHALTRPRLLRKLAERWDHRVTVVEAGAGFGKTTLLAQAYHENLIAPSGADAWVTCEPSDNAADQLVSALSEALEVAIPEGDPARGLAASIWRDSPQHRTLILDDVHAIAQGSPGARLLEDLLTELPVNGHLLLAGRVSPPLPLARLAAQRQVRAIGEAEMAYDRTELAELASRGGIEPSSLADTGGWPALVELVLAAGPHAARDFVWQEVIRHLDADERRAFAALALVGGGDAEIASIAAGQDVDPVKLTQGIPLVSVSGPSVRPHALWAEVLAGEVENPETAAVIRRIVRHLRDQGELVRGVELMARVGDHSELRSAMVRACYRVDAEVLWPDLDRWLGLIEGRDGPLAALLHATRGLGGQTGLTAEVRSRLETAVEGFRESGDVLGECASLIQLGKLAWRLGDLSIVAEHMPRVEVLAGQGVEEACMLSALGKAAVGQMMGDPGACLDWLDEAERYEPPETLRLSMDLMRQTALIYSGRADEAIAVLDGVPQRDMTDRVMFNRVLALWIAGRWNELASVVPLPDADAPLDRWFFALCETGFWAHAGDVDAARSAQERMAREEPEWVVGQRAVEALVLVAGGDDEAARTNLASAMDASAMNANVDRQVRPFCGDVYVLLPDSRDHWDAAEVGPDFEARLAVARAVVAWREEHRTVEHHQNPERVLCAIPLRWALELALAQSAADIPEGQELLSWCLEHLGPSTLLVLRELRDHEDAGIVELARQTLATVPVPPERELHLSAIGSTTLSRDGEATEDANWRRERVRMLLLYLVCQRTASREEVITALWPDLDPERGSRNLRVTLSYLQRVLQPEREQKEAPYFVRQDGNSLTLTGEDRLTVDLWEAERLLDEAIEHDRVRLPSEALRALREAVELWTGEVLDEARYEEWAQPHRHRLNQRLVAAAIRTGELVLAHGEPAEAVALGERALAAEPWSEAAYRLLASAHLHAGHRGLAHRALQRCRDMLAELGADPAPETEMLERRVAGARDRSAAP